MKKRLAPSRTAKRAPQNLRRTRPSFAEVLSSANQRAHEQANRRMGKRGEKFVWAAVASESDFDEEIAPTEWLKRLIRWSLALLLLPLCWVTTWTFLSRFSHATVDQEFWKTAEFWYFATGALLMIGWFWSGLLKSFFLYLYVLGHELTHAVFVVLHRGRVTDFHVSTAGGYITTNKTNLVIALSPYFVPFWSVIAASLYSLLKCVCGFSQEWDRLLFAALGLTWTFHMVWTLWMIPRDQPDLKENGTFLSLVIIYLANLLVLAGLLCMVGDSPLENSCKFAYEWWGYAKTCGDVILKQVAEWVIRLPTVGRF